MGSMGHYLPSRQRTEGLNVMYCDVSVCDGVAIIRIMGVLYLVNEPGSLVLWSKRQFGPLEGVSLSPSRETCCYMHGRNYH